MAAILAFDNKCMNYLLDKRNEEFFSEEYPVFYKNKVQKLNNKNKYFYRYPIEFALKKNQITAVQKIVDYIV